MIQADLHVIRQRIKQVIVFSLELDIEPTSIGDELVLFAPALVGGLELDSLAAIEIVVGLSREFNVMFDEVPHDAFLNVSTLADFIAERIRREPRQ